MSVPSMELADQVNATLHLKLKAKSGYTATSSYRISPNQWGEVVRQLEGFAKANEEQSS